MIVAIVVGVTFLFLYLIYAMWMMDKDLAAVNSKVDQLTTLIQNYRAEAATKRYR